MEVVRMRTIKCGEFGRMQVAEGFGPGKIERKVSRAEKALYARCATAMESGAIFSWSIDDKAGRWLVKVTEGEEWRELFPADVDALLCELGVSLSTTATVVGAPPVKVKAPARVKVSNVVNIATVKPAVWPEWVSEYLGRLVYAAKKDYAELYAAHLFAGAPMPDDPGTEWAEKVRVKFERMEYAVSA